MFTGSADFWHHTRTEREALVERDPVLAKELLKIWGAPKATIDTGGNASKE